MRARQGGPGETGQEEITLVRAVSRSPHHGATFVAKGICQTTVEKDLWTAYAFAKYRTKNIFFKK